MAALAKTVTLGLSTRTLAVALRMAAGERGDGAAGLVCCGGCGSHVITSSQAFFGVHGGGSLFRVIRVTSEMHLASFGYCTASSRRLPVPMRVGILLIDGNRSHAPQDYSLPRIRLQSYMLPLRHRETI